MKNNPQQLQAFLQSQQAKHLYRKPRLNESAQQPLMTIDGRQVLAFCSNDYLGLANHPGIVAALQDSAGKYGVGSGAAHLVNGHHIEHQRLEEALAEFTGRQRALLFSTGYMANLGAINALAEKGDVIFQDRLNHASLIDGGRLSEATMWRYRHSNIADLTRRMAKSDAENKLVITDGVFSMDGDCAPLTELAALTKQQQGWLMVDDAHGFGVLGKHGAGLVEEQGLNSDQVPVLMATLGKAVGTAGAFIAGDDDLIEYLIQSARTYIFTTAMPPAVAAATRYSLGVIKEESWRREQLQSLIHRFKQGAMELGLPMMASDTSIQPLLVGGSDQALAYSQQLLEQGILVTAIRPPTVPDGEARLRITITAAHTDTQIDQLLSALERLQISNQAE